MARTRRGPIAVVKWVGLAIAALLCAAVVVYLVAGLRTLATGTVYTVAQVEAGLQHHPRTWVGRTVLIRGLLRYCPPASLCPAEPALLDPDAGPNDGLLAYANGTSWLISILEKLPFADRLPFFSSPLVHRFGGLGVYRVRLQPPAQSTCGLRL